MGPRQSDRAGPSLPAQGVGARLPGPGPGRSLSWSREDSALSPCGSRGPLRAAGCSLPRGHSAGSCLFGKSWKRRLGRRRDSECQACRPGGRDHVARPAPRPSFCRSAAPPRASGRPWCQGRTQREPGAQTAPLQPHRSKGPVEFLLVCSVLALCCPIAFRSGEGCMSVTCKLLEVHGERQESVAGSD